MNIFQHFDFYSFLMGAGLSNIGIAIALCIVAINKGNDNDQA
jgi:hypothetical protein